MPQADNEDDNPLGLRIWSLSPQVVVRFLRGCASADYRSSARTWLNRVPASWGGGNGAEETSLGRVAKGRVVTEQPLLDAYAGQTVELRIRISCDGRTVEAARTFQLPAASCDEGLMHVYELHGRAEWSDDATHPLRAGDLVPSEAGIHVEPGGRAVVGAAECNGLRLDLGPGDYGIGGYRSDARGDSFSGPHALVTADSHAGGWYSSGLEVLPLGTRCRSCQTASPATFEVRNGRVRVLVGAVLARAGRRSVRVLAGEEAGAMCTTATRCDLIGPRLFQPAEPWSMPVAAPPPRLRAVVGAPRGSTPPRRVLAPAFSKLEVHRLAEAGGAPEQLAVQWSREFRAHPGRAGDAEPQQGVLIWQRIAPTRWRIVYSRRASGYARLYMSFGDVTGDGHPDVLIVQVQGSGACGPRVLAAWAAGRERTLVDRDECESVFRLARDALLVDEPVGQCPYPNASAHCFGGTRHLVMRWSGARLVARRATVTCALPRFDPARNCTRRRR